MQRKLLIIFLLLVNVSLAQEKNPTVWPYGGVPDSSRFEEEMVTIPLKFKKVDFYCAQFDSQVILCNTLFMDTTKFYRNIFNSKVNFKYSQFDSLMFFVCNRFKGEVDFRFAKLYKANFLNNYFYNRVDFYMADFNKQCSRNFNFSLNYFDSLVTFCNAKFDCYADFRQTVFHSMVNFQYATFNDSTSFYLCNFRNNADFRNTKFRGITNFRNTEFQNIVNFKYTQFNNHINFEHAKFDSLIDFRNAQFSKNAIVDFSLAEIKHPLYVGILGSGNEQKYNFMRTNFLEAGTRNIESTTTIHVLGDTIFYPGKTIKYPGAKIILFGPVDLKIQLEKFKFISLYDSLDYYAKKDIISTLKDSSFSDTKFSRERFELDYIFEKSTMYQEKSTRYIENKWYQFWKWPSWFLTTLYYITMGLGYRPFWLLWWVLGLLMFFTMIYWVKLPRQVNKYIGESFGKDESNKSFLNKFDTFANCVYFSAMVLFTFRLKGRILTFFDTAEKKIILTQWFLGFLVYIAFLTLSKAGSILHTLKSLFVG